MRTEDFSFSLDVPHGVLETNIWQFLVNKLNPDPDPDPHGIDNIDEKRRKNIESRKVKRLGRNLNFHDEIGV